jgi:hypothetical protein
MISHDRNAVLLVSSYFARAFSTHCRGSPAVFGLPGAAGRTCTILYRRSFTQEKKKPRRAGLK